MKKNQVSKSTLGEFERKSELLWCHVNRVNQSDI